MPRDVFQALQMILMNTEVSEALPAPSGFILFLSLSLSLSLSPPTSILV